MSKFETLFFKKHHFFTFLTLVGMLKGSECRRMLFQCIIDAIQFYWFNGVNSVEQASNREHLVPRKGVIRYE